jgi:hypothetical protein
MPQRLPATLLTALLQSIDDPKTDQKAELMMVEFLKIKKGL